MSAHHEGCQDCRRSDALRRRFDRRLFLRAGGLSVVSWGFAPRFLGRALAATAPGPARKILVCVFQRGAVDGLNMVVPHGEREYYRSRPTIAIPEPGRGDGRALDLDGFFGLHPSLADLHGWYGSGNLAVVHAVGSPDATRSHFEAQDYMETGVPGTKSITEGWLNRVLAATATNDTAGKITRAFAMTQQMPLSLAGQEPALAVGDLARFLGADPDRDLGARGRERSRAPSSRVLMEGFEALYGRGGRDLVVDAGAEGLDAASFLRAANPTQFQPRGSASYPRSELGLQLRQVAQLIRADVGLEIAFVDSGGWDTHVNQGGAEGQLAARLRDLGTSIGAFARDLEDRLDDIVILTMSEFGRTVQENGSRGTDHGHANAALVLGGEVNGGQVYGRWPGLAPEQRFEGRDLEVTTDFRDLFNEVVVGHLSPRDPSGLFPGHIVDATARKGLFGD